MCENPVDQLHAFRKRKMRLEKQNENTKVW